MKVNEKVLKEIDELETGEPQIAKVMTSPMTVDDEIKISL
jgi:hypothetical protein